MSKESKVNLAKIVLVAAVTAAFNAPASAQEPQMDRKFRAYPVNAHTHNM